MKKFRTFGLLSLVLVLCALLMVTNTEAKAATSDYYTYTVTDGNATITKCDSAISGDVIIPETLDGHPVTAIAEKAFYQHHNITSVTIPKNVTSIGYAAFSDCNNLKNVILHNGVVTIGGSAFSWCVNLESVTIPGSVTTIGNYAFYYCPKLEHVTYCGTDESWGKISIGSVNEALKNATRIYHIWEEATCGTPMTCSLCGATEGAATGLHTYGPWVEILAPTCTKVGKNAKTCSACGDEQYEDIPVTAHTYKDIVTAPDCTQKGFTVHVCSCGDTKVDTYVDALGHDYKAAVTAPTCTEKGYTTYTCACGDSYVDDYVDATGHSLGAWTTVKAATCTADGQEKRVCACGETETRVVAALGHSGVQWFIAYDATCTTTGLKARICATCGITETAVIPALGHDYEETVTAPTCTEEGSTTYSCKACEHSYVGSYVAALGHDWSDWIVTTEATCTEAGEKTRTCPCGGEEKQAIEALGHNWTDWAVTAEPTCTEAGEKIRTCACGAEEKQPIDALGHSWGEWTVTTKPTCTETGEKIRTCACGAEDKQPVDALGHTYESVVTAPTCTEAGYTTHTCACGYSYTDTTVDALGHSWSAWITITAPTCSKEGEEKRVCACGAEEKRGVEMLPHGWSEWIQIVEPTCTTEGVKWHFCNCGATEKAPVETLPHTYVEGVCSVCGAKNEVLFDIDAARMILGNSLEFQFGVKKEYFTTTEGYYAIIEKTWADGSITETKVFATKWIDAGDYWAISYDSLAAKEMADDFYVTIYNDQGIAVSNPRTDSVRDYVMRNIDNQSAVGKTLMVDMLNYGAFAQKNFGYSTDDLANNQLTDAQKAYATAEMKAVSDGRVQDTNYLGTRLVLESRIQLQLAFKNLTADQYAIYTFTNNNGATQEIRVEGTQFIDASSAYVIEASALVYADARALVTYTVYNADGTVYATATDSIESYVARNSTNEAAVMLMKFADSAKAYLYG